MAHQRFLLGPCQSDILWDLRSGTKQHWITLWREGLRGWIEWGSFLLGIDTYDDLKMIQNTLKWVWSFIVVWIQFSGVVHENNEWWIDEIWIDFKKISQRWWISMIYL